jgi:hypothetical protein
MKASYLPRAGTKRYQRYKRTGAFKREGVSAVVHRPTNFRSWLVEPLHVSAGRILRLAREFHKKQRKTDRLYLKRLERDNARPQSADS